MKKNILITLLAAVLLSSCGEYNKLLKSTDYEYKYEAAKNYFAKGQYNRAATLLILMYILAVRLPNWHVSMQEKHCIWIPLNPVLTSLVLMPLFSNYKCLWSTSRKVQRRKKLRI